MAESRKRRRSRPTKRKSREKFEEVFAYYRKLREERGLGPEEIMRRLQATFPDGVEFIRIVSMLNPRL